MHYKIQNNTIIYDFPKSLDFMTQKGKILFGPDFVFYDELMPIIRTLFICMIQDHENMIKLGLDPRKGVLMTGPVGGGKTCLMRLMQTMLHPYHKFQLKPCRDIRLEFQKEGFGIIDYYSHQSFKFSPGYKIPRTICLDDLGSEQDGKHYGNQCNVIAEVLLSRYDLFISDRLITHITTNLDANQIEEMYGTRVRSRLREMVNMISFSEKSEDKRK